MLIQTFGRVYVDCGADLDDIMSFRLPVDYKYQKISLENVFFKNRIVEI